MITIYLKFVMRSVAKKVSYVGAKSDAKTLFFAFDGYKISVDLFDSRSSLDGIILGSLNHMQRRKRAW